MTISTREGINLLVEDVRQRLLQAAAEGKDIQVSMRAGSSVVAQSNQTTGWVERRCDGTLTVTITIGGGA